MLPSAASSMASILSWVTSYRRSRHRSRLGRSKSGRSLEFATRNGNSLSIQSWTLSFGPGGEADFAPVGALTHPVRPESERAGRAAARLRVDTPTRRER